MAQYKLPGGVEDLTFGMGTEQQQRKNTIYVITQIHAGVIPYSSTQSITQKVDQVSSVANATRTDLDSHKLNYDNPHQITPEDVGAASLVHTHPKSDIDGLTEDLANKSDVHHTHDISDVANLQTDLDAKMDDGDAFLKTDHVVESAGASDAGKPIVLGNSGTLDPTIAGSGLIFVAMFTPTVGAEYPDDTGYGNGHYWVIDGVDDINGYLMTTGDLVGHTMYNGDALVIGVESWGVTHMNITPSDYYRLDGNIAISAPFAGGAKQFKNAADGTDLTDLVTKQQLDTKLNLAGGTMTGDLAVDKNNATVHLIGVSNRLVRFGAATSGEGSGYIGRVGEDLHITLHSYDGNLLLNCPNGIVTINDNQVWDAGNFDPSGYLPLTGGTMTGGLTVDAVGAAITIGGTPNTAAQIRGMALDGVSNGWYMGRGGSTSNVVNIANYIANEDINLATTGTGKVTVNGNEIWDTGNFDPSDYLPLTGGILTGNLELNNGGTSTANAYLDFHSSVFGNDFDSRITSSGGVDGNAGEGTLDLSCTTATVNGNEIWDAGNLNPASYLPLAGGTMTGTLVIPDSRYISHSAGRMLGRNNSAQTFVGSIDDPLGVVKGAGAWDFATVPTVNGSDVWTAGNDGIGSGLNADLFQDRNLDAFIQLSNTHATINPIINFDVGELTKIGVYDGAWRNTISIGPGGLAYTDGNGIDYDVWHSGNFTPTSKADTGVVDALLAKIDALTARLDAAGL